MSSGHRLLEGNQRDRGNDVSFAGGESVPAPRESISFQGFPSVQGVRVSRIRNCKYCGQTGASSVVPESDASAWPTAVLPWEEPTREDLTWTPIETRNPQSEAEVNRTPEAGCWIGRYLLIEPLGSGGQATVWRAVQDRPVVREVALKVLHGAAHQCARKAARLRREAERGMRLRGEGLLPTLEFGVEGDLSFLAMPLVRGCTLHDIIKHRRNRTDPLGEAHPLCHFPRRRYVRVVLRALVGVTRSLQRAHEAAVAHRDVKPSNILLDADDPGRGYLIDFGLGRDLDVATVAQLRDHSGTPRYMSPEKLLACQSDELRCDLYALGVTIYEALTLQDPFQTPPGLVGVPLMTYLIARRPAWPRLTSRLHPELETILTRAMDPSPERRPSSAAQLADDLERVLAADTLVRPRVPAGRESVHVA